MFPSHFFPEKMFAPRLFPRRIRMIVPGDGTHIYWRLGKIARIVRVSHNSRQYLVYRVISGAENVVEASVEVAISPVDAWGKSPEPSFSPAEWSADESGPPTVQAFIGPDTAYPLEVGLYKVHWRITAGSESTIVAGNRYVEVY